MIFINIQILHDSKQLQFLISLNTTAMLRKAIQHFQLFPAPATLRIKQQPEKANVCSSIFSIVLYLAFTTIFIIQLIDIFQYKAIISNVNESIPQNATIVQNFPFAIGILGVNISELDMIFSARVFMLGANVSLSLKPCIQDNMPGLSKKQFDEFMLGQYLCLQQPQDIELSGFITDPESKILRVQINPCNATLFPNLCHPDIDAFIADHVAINGKFVASLLPLTTGFNPQNKNATFNLISTANFYVRFSDASRFESALFIANYQVLSDESVLPYEQVIKESGNYIDSSFIFYEERLPGSPYYSGFILSSSKLKVIERTYGKIDEVFSYLGGLFGILLSFFSIFMMSFNQYRYELEVADDNFSMEHDRVKEKHLHFFKYVKYSLYDWIRTLFCCEVNWKDCQRIDEARNQAAGQLQVTQLLRRITNLEKMYQDLTNEKDSDLVYYLIKPNDISTAARTRLIKYYIDKMNNHYESPSIEEIDAKQQLQNSHKMGSSTKLNYITQKSERSIKIIEQYLQRHESEITECLSKLEFTEDDIEAEGQLASVFWQLKQEKRKKMYRRIPINILYRIFENHKKEQQKSKEYFNTLEVDRTKMDSKLIFDSSAEIYPK